jgi:hypothetical protein
MAARLHFRKEITREEAIKLWAKKRKAGRATVLMLGCW